uniref:Uncharacterized protein n=1 Tax=Arundo donax TaxID=35708 RepID=A0A0A8ZSF4_ARUDO
MLLEMRHLCCRANLNYLLLCVVPEVMFPWLRVCICASGFHRVISFLSVEFVLCILLLIRFFKLCSEY